jgi:hypothetical protein
MMKTNDPLEPTVFVIFWRRGRPDLAQACAGSVVQPAAQGGIVMRSTTMIAN